MQHCLAKRRPFNVVSPIYMGRKKWPHFGTKSPTCYSPGRAALLKFLHDYFSGVWSATHWWSEIIIFLSFSFISVFFGYNFIIIFTFKIFRVQCLSQLMIWTYGSVDMEHWTHVGYCLWSFKPAISSAQKKTCRVTETVCSVSPCYILIYPGTNLILYPLTPSGFGLQ